MKPQIRQRVLAEWRGVREPFAQGDRTQTIGEALEKVMRKMGLNDRLTESQILSAWKEIVGDWFAMHTCPNRLRDGVLFVQVIQSTVHYELDRVWKPQILQKLKARFGARKIRDVKFRVN